MTETSDKESTGGHPYVLVVDDHGFRREWTKRALAGGRYKIAAVTSAQQGLRYLRQVQFDVVVVGAHLRGMGVKEFEKKVRQLYPKTPVVVISFEWPIGKDVTISSPGSYHCLILCAQDREAAVRAMVEETLVRPSGEAAEA